MERGLRLRILFMLILLCLGFLWLVDTPSVRAEGEAAFQGFVTAFGTGEPLPNATVIILNLDTGARQTVMTGPDGGYRATVVRWQVYRLYAYLNDLTTPGFDFVPVKSVETYVSKAEVYSLNFTLHPGAFVTLYGQIYYVKSTARPSVFKVEVIDPATGRHPDLPASSNTLNIFTWGDVEDAWSLGFNHSLVVVPSGILVDLKMRTPVCIRGVGFEWIEFLVNNDGVHYHLSQGRIERADLGWYSIGMSVDTAIDYYRETWGRMMEMERTGFYLGKEKGYMMGAWDLMVQAQNKRTQGKYGEGHHDLQVAYTMVTVEVGVMLDWLWAVAESSAWVMPIFPAFFAVTMAFFLFEKIKKKIVSCCILYGLSSLALYYLYPGFPILDVRHLLALISLAFIFALFTAFGVPRFIKEPDIPGPYPFRAVLSVVFSVAKRNVKRRIMRGVLAIASLTILVLAFTAFTSFGSTMGLLVDVKGVPIYGGVLIKYVPPPWHGTERPYLPMDVAEVGYFGNRPGVTLVSPIVWNTPRTVTLGRLVGKGELVISGILGVDPSSEAELTTIDELVVDGSLGGLDVVLDGVVISREAAAHLGAGLGGVLRLYLDGFYGNLTVVGIIDDGGLSGLRDLDGESILPYRVIGGGYEHVNAAEVLILHWKKALRISGTEVSRVALRVGKEVDIDAFARDIVKTTEYNVWVSAGGRVTWYSYGMYIEIGGLTLLIPLTIVLLNLGLVMISIVSERTREIFTLTSIGFNPTHIAALFLAESIVMGLVGGGIGYLMGLSAYRLMSLFDVDIAVRQKLEWYWSFFGVLLSVGVAILSAVRSAARAAMRATPSLVKRLKLPEKERVKREEEVWRAFQAQKVTMPIRVHEKEILFFFSFFSTRMQELERGFFERVEDYREVGEETPEGKLIRRFNFTYIYVDASGRELATVNELSATKKPREDYYSLALSSRPKTAGLPGVFLDRTIRFVRDTLFEWDRGKAQIMGA